MGPENTVTRDWNVMSTLINCITVSFNLVFLLRRSKYFVQTKSIVPLPTNGDKFLNNISAKFSVKLVKNAMGLDFWVN